MPLCKLGLFILYQAPHSQALASTCGALVLVTSTSCLSLAFNPLPNDKVLDKTISKAFADDKLNIALVNRPENMVRKGENAGYHYFLLFPQCFPRPSSSRL